MTHVEKAECEWRASLLLLGPRVLEHWPLLDKNIDIKVVGA